MVRRKKVHGAGRDGARRLIEDIFDHGDNSVFLQVVHGKWYLMTTYNRYPVQSLRVARVAGHLAASISVVNSAEKGRCPA